MTPTLESVISSLENLLNASVYKEMDFSWNGLQVESSTATISKVAVAVDAGLSIIEKAVDNDCQLLITHHGLFWGKTQSPMINGLMGEKIRKLIEGGCSLYASHLPLDGSPEVGNAFEIGRELKLSELQPAFEFEGATVGAIGRLPSSLSFSECVGLIRSVVIPSGTETITCELPFGEDTITTVGIATGSASSLLADAKQFGCDILLSGEPKHESYHTAKELKMNAIFAGHYLTETFGVKAVARHLEEKLNIATVFIDEPTGI